MKKTIILATLVILAVLLSTPDYVLAAAKNQISAKRNNHKPQLTIQAASPPSMDGEIIVKFKNQATGQKIKDLYQLSLLKQDRHSGLNRLKIAKDGDFTKILIRLKSDPDVEYAEPNYIYQAFYQPNDPNYNLQWALPAINAPAAWDQTEGQGIIIAVVDSGVDLNHPDLATNLLKINGVTQGYNAINPLGSVQDDNGHGTHVAGIAAAVTNNNVGVAGVAGMARILPVKVLDQNGNGDVYNIGTGIRWAVDHGAKIINISLGGEESNAVTEAVYYAHSQGALVIAAAGNNGYHVSSPADLPHVVAVAATDVNNQRASFSSYGDEVDIAAPGKGAPGKGIYSTKWHFGSSIYGYENGTSMATPFVSGLAALVWARHPELTNDQVETIIEAAARDIANPGWDSYTGFGLINAAAALDQQLPQDDAFEPNNNFAAATPLSVDSETYATISRVGDEDYYSFYLPVAGRLYVDLVPPGPMDIIAEVLDINGHQVGKIDYYGPGEGDSDSLALTSGQYYISVKDFNTRWAPEPYLLKLSLSPTIDAWEDNNTSQTATPIREYQEVSSTLLPAGDEDWYRFQNSTAGEVIVAVYPPATIDAVVQVYSGGSLIATADEEIVGQPEILSFNAGAAQTYALRVTDYHGFASNLPYRIKLLVPARVLLSGKLIPEGGQDPTGARVSLIPLNNDTQLAYGDNYPAIDLGPDGNYSLAVLPGDYLLQARMAGYLVAETRITVVGPLIAPDITLPGGDLTGDGRVDLGDLILFAYSFGSQPGSPNWQSAADYNGDNLVNISDLIFIARNYR